ncbi:MAG: FG-GAP-like repeat-containing protein [Bacteroidota bacterium]
MKIIFTHHSCTVPRHLLAVQRLTGILFLLLGPALALAQPTVTSVSPLSGNPGSTVTITGINFNSTAANNIVYFGATKATVTAASTTSLTATVPSGATFMPVSVNNTALNLAGYSQYPFLPKYDNATHIQGMLNFNTKVDFTSGTSAQNIAIADIDGDGQPDLIASNRTSNTISVYRNTTTAGALSSASFAAKVDFTTGSNPETIAVGDIDGDGKIDIAVANYTSGTVSVFRNTSTVGAITGGSLNAKVDFTAGSGCTGIAIGDLDGDGRPDMVATNFGSSTISLFRNSGSAGAITTASFTAAVDLPTGTQPRSGIICDADGDGKQDIVLVNQVSNTLSVYRNIATAGTLATGSFAARVDAGTGSGPIKIKAADIDGDGKIDFVAANYNANAISLLRNQSSPGSITLATKVDFATANKPADLAIGDIDGDGKADITVGNDLSTVASIFRNIASSGTITTSSLAARTDVTTGTDPNGIAVGDLDSDGKPDIATANSGSSNISVLKNVPLYLPPTVAAVSPSAANPGTSVTITGTNFNSTTANNIVYFGATRASVTAATNTSLTATVPGGATYMPVSVLNTASTFTGFAQNPFLPTFNNSGHLAGTLNFNAKVDYSSAGAAYCVAVGDIDGDGKTDVAVGNEGVGSVSVFRNTSTSGAVAAASFATRADFTVDGTNSHNLGFADIDGDGKLDLVVLNYNRNTVSVLRNTSSSGSISFAARADFSAGATPLGLAFGDLDGDGKVDIAVANGGSATVSVLRNIATTGTITSASFAAKTDFATPAANNYRVAIADINADGKPEVIVTTYLSNSVSVFPNLSSSGSFTSSSLGTRADFATGSGPIGLAIADVDGSGQQDIIVANNVSTSISVYRNLGAGTVSTGSFAAKVDFTTAAAPYHVTAGDIDGNGKVDIVVANNSAASVSVFRNTATSGSITTSSLASKVDFTCGGSPQYVSVADIDGDSQSDIVVANAGGSTVSVIRNSPLLFPPTVTSLSPYIANPGASVTITGTNFNSTAANNIVYFGATKATVTAASPTSLTATVPVGATFMPVSVNNTALAVAGYSQYPFLPTFNNSANIAGTVSFDTKVDFTSGTNPYNMAIGDLDGDGKPDIAVANLSATTISVFRNTSASGSISAGSFAAKVDYTVGNSPSGIAIGDIDGDGKLDIAVAHSSVSAVSVLKNLSTAGTINSSSFAAKVDFATTGTAGYGVEIDDIDMDGKPELIVANQLSNSISVFRNITSTGVINSSSFAPKVDFATGAYPSFLTTADFDGDGRKDIAVANYLSSNTVSVFRNTSSPGNISASSFASAVNFATGHGALKVAAGDIDGDGKPDLAVSNAESNTISVLRNTASVGTISSTSFAAKVDLAARTNTTEVAFADIDGDSKPDLISCNITAPNYVSVFRNIATSGTISTSSFSTRVDIAVTGNAYSMAVADIDGDHKPDLVAGNSTTNTIVVLRNSPLTAIAGPESVVVGRVITLTNTATTGTWSSSNTAVAHINSSTGLVTGVSPGTSIITYAVAGGSTTRAITVFPSVINTFAGNGTAGHSNGIATSSMLNGPYGVAADTAGNIYIAEATSNRIRKIDASGIITTIAGTGTPGHTGDGSAATAAQLNAPTYITLDRSGNIYFSEGFYVRKINTAGIISTVAGTGVNSYGGDGGAATSATFNRPYGIACDTSGNVYVADQYNHRIRKITVSTGTINTVAGNGGGGYSGNGGAATSAMLYFPEGLAIDKAGNLYIADFSNTVVRKVTAATGVISTVGGINDPGYSGDGGPATSARFGVLTSIAVDKSGNIYVNDRNNDRLRKINVSSGIVTTIAGTGVRGLTGDGGAATSAQVDFAGIGVDSSDNIYIADYAHHRIRIIGASAFITPIAGADTICSGSTVTFSNTTTGGTWSSSNSTIAIIGSASGVITGVEAGSATISYTIAGSATTKVLTVKALPNAGTLSGTTTVCAGSTTTLSSTSSGGTWISSNASVATVGSTGIVNGVTAGTAAITYTATNSCGTATVSADVSVNPLPDAGTLSGTTTVCADSTTALSSTASGGTWSSSNTSVATVGSTGIVNGVAAGTATITYTVTNSCGTATVSAVVSVNPLPNAGTLSGTPTVCAGSTTTLSSTSSGGTWISSNASVATVGSTGIVNGVTAGTAAITYTATNSCGTATVSADVSVNPLPDAGTLSGTTTVCADSTTALSSTASGGTWSSSNASVATVGSTGIVTGIAAGTANITYTVTNSCGTTTVSVVVSVNPLPDAGTLSGTTTVCAGSTTTLSSTTSGGTWSSSNTSVATVSSTGIVNGVAAGAANITYTVTNSCGTATVSAVVSVNPLPDAGTLSGTTTVCVGNTTALSSTISSGTWSSSNTSAATVGSTGIVNGVSAGTSNITYTVTNSCGTATESATITVSPLPVAGTITGASSVCAGSALTLGNTGSGGVWSSSNTAVASVGSTGVVTGIAAGNATISYTATNSCGTSVATKSFTVNAVPSAGTISGPSSVFPGATIVLTNSAVGGTWSASNGNATVSAGGIVTGVSAGAVTISYSVTGACGTSVATKAITVASPVDDIIGTLTVCSGQTTTLNNSTAGGTWTSGNTGVATIGSATGVVTGVSGGTAIITYIAAGDYATAIVTITQTPSLITGTLSACAGNTTSLTASGTGGTWSSANTPVATVAGDGMVTGVAAGTALISYTTGGSCARTTIVTINAQPGTVTGDQSICVGATSTLSNTVSGGTWSGLSSSVANITASGVVTGVSAGTAEITYTLPGSCSTTAIVSVTALPVSIAGPGSVCAGSAITLTNSTTGGSWNSSAPSVATVGSSTGAVTGVAAGTSVISYVLGSGCYATRVVTVKSNPAAIAGTLSVCTGATTALSSATTPGVSWTSGNTTVATINSTSGLVTGVAAGTAGITYTIGSGCTATAIVTVSALPANITGTFTACPGTTTILANTVTGGTWASSNTAVATADVVSGIITGVTAGTARITYTLGSGCYKTAVVTVNTLPSAISGAGVVCTGSTTTLANSSGVWTSGDPSVASVVTPGAGYIQGVSAGTATITFRLGTGCYTTKVVTVNPVPAAIAGTAVICKGSSATLTNTVSGGAWTSANVAVATIGSATGVFTGIGAGNAVISYSIGSCRVTRTVTVNNSAAISGSFNLCMGGTTALTNSVGGGTWSSANTAVATVGSTGLVAGAGAGTAVISYVTAAGCTNTATVTVNAAPSAITGVSLLCTGTTITLGNATAGGTWSVSNSAVATIGVSSGIVTGVAAGNTTVTYTVGTGCRATATITVNAISAITGPTSLCVGSTSTLYNATAGGTWSSSDISIATAGATTGIITGIATGSAIISYTSPSGCAATITVNVNPAASAVAGNAPICVGTSITLSNPTSGGTWSGAASSAISGPSGGIVTGVSPGTAIVTYTLPSGCRTITNITVNPLPATISGTGTSSLKVCPGTTLSLTDATAGGTWSSGNASLATVGSASGIVSGIAAGIANISYIISSGCYRTVPVTVNPNPAAITGTFTVCATMATTLANTTPGGSAWTSSNTAIATVTAGGGVVNGVAAGTANITYTLGTGCRTSATVTVEACSRPANPGGSVRANDFQLYPNPTTGSFMVEASDNGRLIIYTLDGRELANHSITAGATRIELPKGIASGVYMCRYLGNGGQTVIVRLVYE